MASTDIYVAKESFSTEDEDGNPIVVKAGVTRVRAGHPLLKGRKMFFELLTVHYDVEQATAKPGEQRGAPAPALMPAPEPTPTPAPAPAPAPAPTPAPVPAKPKSEDK